MQERVDRTEPVAVLGADGALLARAVCRYTLATDGWHGMLSDIRPAGVLQPGPYTLRFDDGRAVTVTISAFSPRDLRRAYFAGDAPPG